MKKKESEQNIHSNKSNIKTENGSLLQYEEKYGAVSKHTGISGLEQPNALLDNLGDQLGGPAKNKQKKLPKTIKIGDS